MNSRQKAILRVLRNSPVQFGYWVGFKDLTELHNKWMISFLYGKEDQTLLSHRGSYKTTVLSLCLALIIVLKPSTKTLFFRKTDPDVQEVIAQVSKILKTGAVKRIVNDLYGIDFVIERDTAGVIDTNLNTSTRGTPQLMGLGIGTSITGKHADIVVTDDIVNLTDRLSPSEREKTKLRYMELENIKSPGGRFINAGTPWHKDDAISIMPNIKRYDCYHTGLLTQEQIKDLQSKMTASLFAANYELRHIADKDAIFTTPAYTEDVERIYGGIMHIDAAYGGDDRTAVTILSDSDGYVAYGKLFTGHVDDHIAEIQALREHYMAGTIYCEDNGDKGYLARNLESAGEIVETYHESMNKYIKIVTYAKTNWNNITFIDDTDTDYIAEVLDYTEHAAHDDAPDSLASAIRQLQDKAEIQLFPGGII